MIPPPWSISAAAGHGGACRLKLSSSLSLSAGDAASLFFGRFAPETASFADGERSRSVRKISSFAGVAAALALLSSQPLAGTAATLPKVGLPTVSTPAANLPAVTTPQVTVPSVTVPSVTIPQVTTPAGPTPTLSTPSVTTPTATTPKLSTPVVKTPSVTTPSSTPPVTTPSVTTPSVTVPSGTTPLVKTPNLPGASSSSSSSSSAPAGASGSSPATTPTPSSAAGGQRAAGTTASAGSSGAVRAHSASSPTSSAGERRSHRGEAISRRSRQAQERAENRRLRNVVERYQGCMGSLDSRSERLLSLRAGLHGSPRSAGAVARILHISAGREQLLERMSLLALQTAGHGGCGGSSAVTTVPVSGPTQLTSTAPWVTGSGATPVSTGSGSSSASPGSASSGAPSQQHVRAAGGRSAAPVVITPAATRTVEQASTGQDAVSWPEIVLLAILVMAVSLVLVPAVRRRLMPALAGLPPAEGHVGLAGTRVASVTAASVLPEAPAPAPGAPAPEATVPDAPVAAAPAPSRAPEPPETTPALTPQSQPEGATLNHQPVVQPQRNARTTWVREHATQGALVATVLAGGLVRILKRGRRR